MSEWVSVGGKLILSGEHSVVYGKLAVAVRINKQVSVKLIKGVKERRYCKNDVKNIIQRAIEVAGGQDDWWVEIESELPIGCGLGSSAALATAIILAVKQELKVEISKQELFDLVMKCEVLAHGNPSGIDSSVVIYGGLIVFQKQQSIKRLKMGRPIKLLIVNSGKPIESTKDMVELVADDRRRNEMIIERIGRVTREIVQKLIDGGEIFELINKNGLLLEELGVVGKKARRISSQLRAIGCAVKITGAGGVGDGSGMMIVMSNDLLKTKSLLHKMKLDYFEVNVL